MFDGHGGVDAAIYASIHLHVNMVHQEMFQQDPAEALCRAFRVTDERFVQKAAREVRSSLGLPLKALTCEFCLWQQGCSRGWAGHRLGVSTERSVPSARGQCPRVGFFMVHRDVSLRFSPPPARLEGRCCNSCVRKL